MKRIAVGALALGLSGCNVTSQEPLFSPAEAARHQLVEGTWAMYGPGCDVAIGAGVVPDCAIPTTFTREGRWTVDPDVAAARFGVPIAPALAFGSDATVLLVEGDPDILQIKTAPPPGPTKADPGAADRRGYAALKPVHIDPAGRIDSAIAWVLTCPKAGQPMDGFEMKGGKCTALSAAAVRSRAPHVPPLMSYFLTWTGPAAPPAPSK